MGGKSRISGSQVRACSGRSAEWTRGFLCFGGDSAVRRCLPMDLQVWEQKVFCPRRRVSRFPLRPRVHATALTRPSSRQWALCSRQEGQPSLNVMVWRAPSPGWKTELIQLSPGVLGFEPATSSMSGEDEKLITGRVGGTSTLKSAFQKTHFHLGFSGEQQDRLSQGRKENLRSWVFRWGPASPSLTPTHTSLPPASKRLDVI